MKHRRGHELAASLVLAAEVDDALAAEQVIHGPARYMKHFRDFRNSIQLLKPGFGFALFDLHEFVCAFAILSYRQFLERPTSMVFICQLRQPQRVKKRGHLRKQLIYARDGVASVSPQLCVVSWL
jgi:hypothetical protein